MSAQPELTEDRIVEGVYAVARKQRLRTRAGAPYLALELVDPAGRIEARVWSDSHGGTPGSPMNPLLMAAPSQRAAWPPAGQSPAPAATERGSAKGTAQ